eukprot:11191672-Alexandrium_andersonii.AAC.1
MADPPQGVNFTALTKAAAGSIESLLDRYNLWHEFHAQANPEGKDVRFFNAGCGVEQAVAPDDAFINVPINLAPLVLPVAMIAQALAVVKAQCASTNINTYFEPAGSEGGQFSGAFARIKTDVAAKLGHLHKCCERAVGFADLVWSVRLDASESHKADYRQLRESFITRISAWVKTGIVDLAKWASSLEVHLKELYGMLAKMVGDPPFDKPLVDIKVVRAIYRSPDGLALYRLTGIAKKASCCM